MTQRLSETRAVPFATLAFILIGGATIAAAWGFQLIGGYLPCKLCLEQRHPYYAALPLAAVALAGFYLGWGRTIRASLLLLAGAAMLYGAGLGVYQAGAEWAFWPGPADCGSTGDGAASINDLMSQLQSTRLVSCTEASWRMFGLSFAGWNAVASTVLALVALAGALSLLRRAEPAVA
ncbi:MAG: disulfide bond formation protein B [Pseudomonadota bacterium]